ncbi:cation transporter [Spirochaetia bacterium]|nr:cation transporter [Spirochaetia bacterium]
MKTEKQNINVKAGLIKKASLIAICGNIVLAAAKITLGLVSGSLAVVGDGIDTSIDVLISAMTLFVSRVIAQPADTDHPWGHGRAETIATTSLSFILFFAGFQLIISSASNLISGKELAVPEPAALIVTCVSIAGKLLLAFNQYATGKKAQSPMLMANAKNMAGDVFISAGVLVGLAASRIFNIGAIDAVAALLVGVWVLKSAVSIFMETNTELMDGGSLPEQYGAVFEAVHSVEGAGNPHRARMRRIAGFWDIDLDIEVDGNLTVKAAHVIANKVEDAIRQKLADNIFDIMVHIEPAGAPDNEKNEGYGLNEESISKGG